MAVTLPRGPATNILAGLTFLAFLPVYLTGATDRAAQLAGFIPGRIAALIEGVNIDAAWLPLWLTPLSATLLHSGWMHLIFNLLMLIFCGRHVEQLLGQAKTDAERAAIDAEDAFWEALRKAEILHAARGALADLTPRKVHSEGGHTFTHTNEDENTITDYDNELAKFAIRKDSAPRFSCRYNFSTR